MGPDELGERLRQRFDDVLVARGEVNVTVGPADLPEANAYLHDEDDLAFRFLSDVTCSDWPGADPRFWLAYHLLSMEQAHRVRVKVGLPPVPDPPHVASL